MRLLPDSALRRGVVVRAREAGCGRVVVQLGAVDGKGAHGEEHGLGEAAGPVGLEEALERPSHPVVVK